MTEYTYNALDLVSHINYNEGKQADFAYNKVGQLVQMDDWTGTNTFELDLLGQLKKATDHKGNVVEYTYDRVGNETSITYPNGDKVLHTYDEVYNLTQVQDPEDGIYTYTYDDANRPIKQTYPNGWVETTTYDGEGNVLTVTDEDPFQLYNKEPKLKFEYRYDAEGNVIYEMQRDSDAEESRYSYTTFTYDALNRLTASVRDLDVYPHIIENCTYTYDSLGNLIRETRPENKKTTTQTYTYNDLNQMVRMEDCGYIQSVNRINNFGYTYDKRGNLVKEEELCSPTTQGLKNITIAEYTFDETNRMVMGTNKEGEASLYTFNALGVRVGTELIIQDNTHGYTDFHCETPSVDVPATGPHGPEVVKTDYVIDYNRLNVDQRVLVKHEIGGYDFRYTYGLDKVQAMVTSEGSDWWGQVIHKCEDMNYVHTDRQGSVTNLSDEYGRVTARVDYDNWGAVRAYTDITIRQGFRILMPEITYAGHEYDDVLDQYYAKARMYDAEHRRFTSLDPIMDGSVYDISERVSDPMMFVQYLYVKDNPLTHIDPLGMIPYDYMKTLAIAHANGFGLPSEAVALAAIPATIGNPFLALHQLTQIFVASYMMGTGWYDVEMEYNFKKHGASSAGTRRADIVGTFAGTQYLFEVKPIWLANSSASYVQAYISTQVDRYYEYLNCIRNGLTNKTYRIWDRTTNPPLFQGSMMKRLLATEKYSLYLKITNLGNGLIGYEPEYQENGGQLEPYQVKVLVSHFSEDQVWEPERLTEGKVVLQRVKISKHSSGMINLSQDIRSHRDGSIEEIREKMEMDFYKNGAKAVFLGIYIGTAVVVAGAIAVDAGLVTVALEGGAEVAATIKSSAAAVGYAIAQKGDVIIDALQKGKEIVFKFLENGVDKFYAVRSPA